MTELENRQGVACPCVFWHESRSLVSSVHSDDFTTAGSKLDLDWFELELEAKYELRKGGRIGPGKDMTWKGASSIELSDEQRTASSMRPIPGMPRNVWSPLACAVKEAGAQ